MAFILIERGLEHPDVLSIVAAAGSTCFCAENLRLLAVAHIQHPGFAHPVDLFVDPGAGIGRTDHQPGQSDSGGHG